MRYEPGQRVALREFQRAHFGPTSRQCDDRVFEWVFERNPYCAPEGPALWLYKRDGAVVGQQGAIPVALKVGDRECRASWGIDLMVHPAWWLKGVGPALISEYEKSTDVCLGLGLAEDARRAFGRRGWTDMGKLPLFVRPLDPAAFNRRSGALNMLAKAVPRSLFSASASMLGCFSSAVSGVSLDLVPQFDEHADSIYSDSSGDYPVLVKRDFSALRWRFDEAPSRARYERYYLKRKNHVIGYAVVRFDTLRGQRIARLIDYLSARRWLPSLLALLIAELNRRAAVAVFIEHLHSRCAPLLKALGCWHLSDSTHFMFYAREAKQLAPADLSVASWFATLGDSDCDHLPRQEETDPPQDAVLHSHK